MFPFYTVGRRKIVIDNNYSLVDNYLNRTYTLQQKESDGSSKRVIKKTFYKIILHKTTPREY